MYNGIYDKDRFAYEYEMLHKWLVLKINGGSLAERLSDSGIRSAAVYGAAGLGQDVYAELAGSSVEICCYIDRRANEYPEGMNGIPVKSVSEYCSEPAGDIVLVTPEYYFEDIFQTLSGQGIPDEKIISLAMALS